MSSDPPAVGDEPAAGPTDPAGEDPSFFVVGIGASAGGLEAVSSLLRRTTIDGAAFVVVQHLAPNQRSMLTELLGRASILAVETVADGVVIKKNHVYVTPPNAVLALEGARIRLVAPSPGARPEMPIDAFFRSAGATRRHPCRLSLAGRQPWPQGDGRRHVGNRHRRNVRTRRDQGRGRDDVRAGASEREVRRHAAQRIGERLGRLLPHS